ncbi:MAG: cysteine--tRNA ligase [Patescibacteria group bacterium]|nr:cysteine--tRNA ligase [Patescibacteria group bacterium]
MKIHLYNSLNRKKEEFVPIKTGKVGLYSCGPTVYDHPHIGNLGAYIVWDVLKRFLISQGYRVKHVMNITDVGHLTSDADEGEDKLELASRRSGRSAWQIAEYFLKVFRNNINNLNIVEPDRFIRATETIKEQVHFIKILSDKGFLYKINDGLYFDTSKLPSYGRLANLQAVDLQAGARVEENKEKKNPSDFAVWKFSPEDKKRDMEWDSPWGVGFPGWHLECSVMSRMELGDTFDIHTGGEDHLSLHHPNEMAQSEAATGQLQANYWLHNAFIKYQGGKMSKSAGSFFTLENIKEKSYAPMAYRFLVLQNHYRSPLNFTWESLSAAQAGLKNIVREIAFYDKPKKASKDVLSEFYQAMADDLATPRALSFLQEVINSNLKSGDKLATIFKMDKVLGLDLENLRDKSQELPSEAHTLLKDRELARKNKDWTESDRLREKLTALGIDIYDTPKGQKAIWVRL